MKKVYTSKDLKDDFAVTFQFTNKDGGTDMLLTTNDSEKLDLVSMRLHGMELAERNTEQLGDEDHEALQAFCRAYLEGCGYDVM